MSKNKPHQPNHSLQVQASFIGPIPPPQILQQYNNIVPNAAERIISMAEKQSDHRIDLEKKVVNSGIHKSHIGMFLATAIALYGLYIAKEIAINGNPWAAGIIAALDLGGLISVSIYNGINQKNEREARQIRSSAPPGSK